MYKSHFSYPKARVRLIYEVQVFSDIITNCHPGGLTSMLQPLEWEDLFGESDDEDFEGIV